MPRLRLLPAVTTVLTEQDAIKVLTYLMNRGGSIAIDSETTGLDVMRARILCWSMATEDARFFIPAKFIYTFIPLFNRPDITWYLANAKFDMHMFANHGIHFVGKVQDIIVADAMEDDTRQHGLKEQSKFRYDVRWGDFKDLFLDPAYVAKTLGLVDKHDLTKFKSYTLADKLMAVWEQNPTVVENYASCDAYFTYMCMEDLEQQLVATPLPTEMAPGFDTLWDYFSVIEVPFTKVLWKMERTGIPVDVDYVKKIDGPLRDGITGALKEIRDIVGSKTFNPTSNEELADLLFGKHGFKLAPVSFTKTGAAAVGERDLTSLQNRVKDTKVFNLLKSVLKLRKLSKLHGTYVEDIRDLLGPDGRVHCKLNQTGARTGRLSATNPNLQNIPIRNDKEFKLRGMFIAPKGMKLMDCDYPQIQPRLAAVFANETKMLEAIRKGWDIHSANAANMYAHVDPDATFSNIEAAKQVKDARERALTEFEAKLLKYRDGAKTVGLGVLFGEGPQKMAHQLGLPDVMAGKKLIADFFHAYPNLKLLIDDTHAECHLSEYAYTMLGRIRRLHKINNPFNFGQVAAEERAGFNHKIQGSEVEIVKLAMLQIDSSKEWNDLGGQLAVPVHDELISFAPTENVVQALHVKKTIMSDPLQWGPISIRLPISVEPDGAYGDNWLDVH